MCKLVNVLLAIDRAHTVLQRVIGQALVYHNMVIMYGCGELYRVAE